MANESERERTKEGRSRRLEGLTALLMVAAVPANRVAAQVMPAPPPPQPRYSTHDWSPIAHDDFNEVWADTKTPGDGRTYSVGTIVVRSTDPMDPNLPASFSGQPADAVWPWWRFVRPSPVAPVQVVILQAMDEGYSNGNRGVVWQRYFYGHLVGGAIANARAVSVWPAATDAETRIAICGETGSFLLPHSQDVNGIGCVGTNGFIAVFDGLGTLKWSHLFYGNNGTSGGNP